MWRKRRGLRRNRKLRNQRPHQLRSKAALKPLMPNLHLFRTRVRSIRKSTRRNM